MRLYRPPFTCGQRNMAASLVSVLRWAHSLLGWSGVPSPTVQDRDEVKLVLQKWEKEVQAETILHLTPSMNVDGSSAHVAEALGTPLDPVPPSSIPSGITVATTI